MMKLYFHYLEGLYCLIILKCNSENASIACRIEVSQPCPINVGQGNFLL